MKTERLLVLALFLSVVLSGCAPLDSRHTVGSSAALGTVLGAAYGQAIGGDTEGTLIGAALGGLVGSVMDDVRYRQHQAIRDLRQDERIQVRAPAPQYYSPPPAAGRWLTVPASYVDGYYVPSHNVFLPTATQTVIVER